MIKIFNFFTRHFFVNIYFSRCGLSLWIDDKSINVFVNNVCHLHAVFFLLSVYYLCINCLQTDFYLSTICLLNFYYLSTNFLLSVYYQSTICLLSVYYLSNIGYYNLIMINYHWVGMYMNCTHEFISNMNKLDNTSTAG